MAVTPGRHNDEMERADSSTGWIVGGVRVARTVWESPITDLVAAVLLTSAHVLLVEWRGLVNPLGELELEVRRAVYLSAAPTVGIIVSFATSAMLYYYATVAGRRVAVARRLIGEQIRRVWLACLRLPLAAAAFFLALAVLDQRPDGTDPGVLAWTWAAQLIALATAFRLSRLLWLFRRIVELAGEDLAEGSAPEGKVGGARRPTGPDVERATPYL